VHNYSDYNIYERVLQTYSLTEILEYNDLPEEEILELLVEYGIIKLPKIKPVDTVCHD